MELSPESQTHIVDIANKLSEYILENFQQKTDITAKQFIDDYAKSFGYAYNALTKSMGYK